MQTHTYIHVFKSGTVARVAVRVPRRGQRITIPYLIRWSRIPPPGDAPEYRQWREGIIADVEALSRQRYRMVDRLPMFAVETAK